MSGEQNASSNAPDDMMRQWFNMALQTAEACQKWAVNPISPEAMRETRSNVFKVWGDYWEQFFRSSAFLNADKQILSGGIEQKKKIREFLGQLHHEMQLATAPDIDNLMRTLRQLSEDQQEQFDQIGAQLEKMAERLNAIEQRLQHLEHRNAEHRTNSGPTTSIPRNRPKRNSKNTNNTSRNR